MDNNSHKLYGVKIQCVNAKNIYNVKYKYKTNTKTLVRYLSMQLLCVLTIATILSVLLLGIRILFKGTIWKEKLSLNLVGCLLFFF